MPAGYGNHLSKPIQSGAYQKKGRLKLNLGGLSNSIYGS